MTIDQTIQAVKDLHLNSPNTTIVFLEGDLGAGKTYFVRKFVESFEDKNAYNVISPTFVLLREFNVSGINIAHFDLYRLKEALQFNPEQILEEIGFWDALEHADIIFVEWGRNLEKLLKSSLTDVNMVKIKIIPKTSKKADDIAYNVPREYELNKLKISSK